jgi:hypothetical protein
MSKGRKFAHSGHTASIKFWIDVFVKLSIEAMVFVKRRFISVGVDQRSFDKRWFEKLSLEQMSWGRIKCILSSD